MNQDARERSIEVCAKRRIIIPRTLPLLEPVLHLKTLTEVLDRLFCLHAMAASSFAFGTAKALAWLQQERLEDCLVDVESDFLHRSVGDKRQFQLQIEGMWALAWCVGFHAELDFWKDCDDRFVQMLPNLKIGASSSDLRSQARTRPLDEVIGACDLAYCLHWAIRQAELDGTEPPAKLKPHVVVERRRALEWLLSELPWDEIELDT
jgi:hypothetical protein